MADSSIYHNLATALLKQQTKIDSSDFKMNLKNWYKERHETTPTRDHTFVPDMGRIREEELDAIKPASLMSPEEKLKYNVAQVNKKR
jgi:ADP-ribosylglycohydrolase